MGEFPVWGQLQMHPEKIHLTKLRASLHRMGKSFFYVTADF